MVFASKQTKTPSIHHKKRLGQHHKPTKSYHKTYWPYLPLVAIVGLGIVANSLWTQHHVLGYATDMSVSELFADTNVQRSANGEAGLNLNSKLDAAAQAKADSMVALDYWSHDTPSGQPPWVFISNAGYNYAAAGENLAYGFDTSQDVITAWMGSPEHRANILNNAYQDVGFGIASSSSYQSSGPETIVVAEYGEPATVTPAPATTKPTTSTPATTTAETPTSTPVATPAPTTTPAPTAASTAKPLTTAPTQVIPKATPTSTPVAVQATPVSRLQLVSDNEAPLSAFTVSSLAALCLAVFFIRHGLIWRRVLKKGEKFAIKYHLLDVALVATGVAGFVLTRSAGFIH